MEKWLRLGGPKRAVGMSSSSQRIDGALRSRYRLDLEELGYEARNSAKLAVI